MHGAAVRQLQLEACRRAECKQQGSVGGVFGRGARVHRSAPRGCRSAESALWGRTSPTTEAFVRPIRWDVN